MASVIQRNIRITIILLLIFAGCWFVVQQQEFFKTIPNSWSAFVEPGKLSRFHASMEKNCQECHTPYRGVDRNRCVVCHAAPTAVLKKQNTAFHASVTSCAGCHIEHQGKDALITKMNHVHLVSEKSDQVNDPVLEKKLNCFSCHANQDRHRSLFGNDCSNCHHTNNWTIASFSHPSATSHDCSQCHQAPPSHYMMHFKMISMKVAGVEQAEVNQCFLCHQTTTWNDIKGVGWYKHH